MLSKGLWTGLIAVSLTAGLSGCGGRAADSTLLRESFDSGDMYSRTVDGSPAEACEAARRTLLSQGYAIARADGTGVEGSKNFQPRDDDHEQLVLRISCAPRGEQALVFKNRRGYAPVLICHDCGWSAHCKRCDAAMTVHAGGRRLVCHHCGARATPPNACPDCASLALQPQGAGTERIEEALAERFPDALMIRVDRETTRRREKQMKYNEENGITPTTVFKSKEEIMKQTSVLEIRRAAPDAYIEMEDEVSVAAEPVLQYMTAEQLHKAIEATRKKMLEASKDTDFLSAARYRDEMQAMQKLLKEKTEA